MHINLKFMFLKYLFTIYLKGRVTERRGERERDREKDRERGIFYLLAIAGFPYGWQGLSTWAMCHSLAGAPADGRSRSRAAAPVWDVNSPSEGLTR